MEDQALSDRLETLERKLDAVIASTEKTRHYLLWMLVAAVVAFVLPLVGLVFAIPSFLSTYSDIAGMNL